MIQEKSVILQISRLKAIYKFSSTYWLLSKSNKKHAYLFTWLVREMIFEIMFLNLHRVSSFRLDMA